MLLKRKEEMKSERGQVLGFLGKTTGPALGQYKKAGLYDQNH